MLQAEIPGRQHYGRVTLVPCNPSAARAGRSTAAPGASDHRGGGHDQPEHWATISFLPRGALRLGTVLLPRSVIVPMLPLFQQEAPKGVAHGHTVDGCIADGHTAEGHTADGPACQQPVQISRSPPCCPPLPALACSTATACGDSSSPRKGQPARGAATSPASLSSNH